MSLDRFMQSRLLVQSPETRLYDAARAMEDNHVGAVLVHDGQGLVGIVTDRDLGLKVIGDDLDAFEFHLSDVMSSPVATVVSSATVAEVVELMLDRHVRRIPIVDGREVLGIVTLDDLLLEEAVDSATLAGIVRRQLAEPSRLKPAGRVRPGAPARNARGERARHEAHQRRSYARLLRRALAKTQLTMAEQAERALEIVLGALLRRVTADEAAHALAQLPSRLREYAQAHVASGPDRSVTRDSIEAELDRQLELGPERAAEVLLQTIRALETSIDDGELHGLARRLPTELKHLLSRR
jgi:CBS domain-containing protein/uncharacterized protein (DUF2267 family)